MPGLPDWSFAHGRPECRARIRSQPEDFEVEEVLGFTADGEGEHALLEIVKRGANTDWVARELARIAGVRTRDVSYAGRKDRHAVTRQHFSVWLGGRAMPEWPEHAEYRVLSAQRHRRKLRLGALKGNRFRLVLRELSQSAADLETRLTRIREQGVPNYFGTQRFGHAGNNIARAERMFAEPGRIRDRTLRSLLLSTARSLIFNAILSERVRLDNWNTPLPGEACMLNGTHSVFRAETVDKALCTRVASGDVHPTGPLWGVGERLSGAEAAALEQSVAAQYPVFTQGLEAARLAAARRSLRLPVPELVWHRESPHELTLEFFLPAGCYATTVLRELVTLENANAGVEADAEEN
ncbi:MAG TPA: tRNA pseudouridine(13) synthase TruD [Gammaproteobacteria bacterium]|nr:tRNA pseudouridine(13) synthase TruD [Gammaproteobacteria bacterium]